MNGRTAVRIALPLTVAGLLLVGLGVYRYRTTSSQSVYALKVNGTQFSPGAIATEVASAERFAAAAAGHRQDVVGAVDTGAVIEQIIERTISVQEAERRGLTCSAGEAASQEATQVAQGVTAGAVDQIIAAAAGYGIVPTDYLETPAEQRTPEVRVVIEEYLASPQLADAAVSECAIGKLYAQLRQTSGGGMKGEQAIRDVKAQLRASASLSGPALSITPGTVITAGADVNRTPVPFATP